MKRLTLFIAVLILLAPIIARTDPRTNVLDDESKLNKPITLSLRAVSLKDLLEDVQTKTGVRLNVTPEVAEDKASVWVKERSARDVLCALAHCYNLCWTVSEYEGKKFYHLRIDRTYLDNQQRRDYEDYKAIIGQWDEELKKTGEYVRSGSPYDPPKEMMDKLSENDAESFHRHDRRRTATRLPKMGAAVLNYLSLSDSQKESLINGNHATVSGTIPGAGPEECKFDYWVEGSVSGYMLRCAIRTTPLAAYLLSSAYFEDGKYSKLAEQSAKEILNDKSLDRKLDPADATVRIQYGEGSGMVASTMSDDLIRVAEKLKIPFVAQYISEYNKVGIDTIKGIVYLPASSAKTAAERLAELCKQHIYTIEHDGNFMLAKNPLWHRLRKREVPEENIKRWQNQFLALDIPTFDAYVNMAKLNWYQVRGTIANSPYWFIIHDLIDLARCEYALRLYGSLSTEQQGLLQAGSPISVSTFTPQQQRVFMQGFEASEQPTYALASDESWPSTAAFSMSRPMLASNRVIAIANMKFVVSEQIDLGTQLAPNAQLSEEEINLLLQKCETGLHKTVIKLTDRIPKEFPDVKLKDVTFYCVRTTEFTLRLGKDERKRTLIYYAKAN